MTVGEQLKRERKKQNRTLDDVAEDTKISKMFLIALENDEIERLPGGVYTRSFIRAYARFLGIDEDILTAEYHEQFSIRPQFELAYEQTKMDDRDFARQRRDNLVKLTLVIVVLAILVLGFRYVVQRSDLQPSLPKPESRQPVESPVVSSQTRSVVPEPDRGESGEESDQDQALGILERIESSQAEIILPYERVQDMDIVNTGPGVTPELDETFTIQALESVWLEITIDGTSWTKRLLEPGETRSYRYGQVNELKVGDIASIAVQDGDEFRSRMSSGRRYIGSLRFGPGDLLDAVDGFLSSPMQEE